MPGTYCFAYICYGGYGANTLGTLEDLINKKGINLSYAEGVIMPKSNASASSPKKIQQVVNIAITKVEKAAKEIGNKVQRPIKRKALLLTKIANRRLYKNIELYDKKYAVTNQCKSCGLCVKICPVNNIKIDEQYPIWLHHCERCLRCFQWCPNEAIQYGRVTLKWRRYHNPYIKVNDLYWKPDLI